MRSSFRVAECQNFLLIALAKREEACNEMKGSRYDQLRSKDSCKNCALCWLPVPLLAVVVAVVVVVIVLALAMENHNVDVDVATAIIFCREGASVE